MSREKGGDLTQSYGKSPYTHNKKTPKSTWQHKNATKNFAYTTIAVSWGNESHTTGVVQPVFEIPPFPLTAKAV